MSKNLNRLYHITRQSIFFWTFAFISYAIFRFYGMDEELSYLTDGNFQDRSFKIPLFVSTIIGISLGLIYGVIDFLYEKYILKNTA